jgi:hypothetical protein
MWIRHDLGRTAKAIRSAYTQRIKPTGRQGDHAALPEMHHGVFRSYERESPPPVSAVSVVSDPEISLYLFTFNKLHRIFAKRTPRGIGKDIQKPLTSPTTLTGQPSELEPAPRLKGSLFALRNSVVPGFHGADFYWMAKLRSMVDLILV